MKIKYPRTYHLPWTESATADDKILTPDQVVSYFSGRDVCVSLKMDGENTTIGKNYSHARSVDSGDHWSRHHIKQLAAKLAVDIPEGWRICGENLMATHSIEYKNLSSYFYVFAILDGSTRLSLSEMIEYCDYTNLDMVPILSQGKFESLDFKNRFGLDFSMDEGYVLSNSGRFHLEDMHKNVAKVVRPCHVQPNSAHWTKSTEKNSLVSTK